MLPNLSQRCGRRDPASATHTRLEKQLASDCVPFQPDHVTNEKSVRIGVTINLFPSRPCPFALGTLASRSTRIFLKLVSAIEVRCVGRSIELRANAKPVDRHVVSD